MATVTDTAVVATNVGGDQNSGTTGLPTPTVTSVITPAVVTSVVNLVVTPVVPRGLLNHYEHPEKFTGVHFKRW
ncbi:hypothetical protein CsSME_00015571 [Camellia sinensis var. sinensis]